MYHRKYGNQMYLFNATLYLAFSGRKVFQSTFQWITIHLRDSKGVDLNMKYVYYKIDFTLSGKFGIGVLMIVFI